MVNTYDKAERIIIWLDCFLGLEYKYKKELIDYIDDVSGIEELVRLTEKFLTNAVGENAFRTLKNSANERYTDYVISSLEKKGIIPITLLSKDYPESLLNTEIPPLVLYCKGNISLLKEKTFGIVGSRKSLPLSINVAKNYATALSKSGYALVTGIAEGVDATVLKSALESEGKPISVIAGGFDNIYPSANKDLLEKVIAKGLAISEYPPETVPKPYQFPVRNRIIAGLSKGVLIVSGGIKSGTLYTAEYAEEYGKDLFAVPYSVGVLSGAGCNDLIKRGARLTDTPQDILEYYGETTVKETILLTDAEKQIVGALKDGEMHVEKLCNQLGKRIFEITPTLSSLEIKGIVVKSGNTYGLTRNDLEA